MQLSELVALKLEDARAALNSDARFCACEIRVTQTAPPFRPQQNTPKSTPEKRRTFRPTQAGDWRVLRGSCRENTIELTVAREELRADESPAGADL